MICQCGCGGKTSIISKTSISRGRIKGEFNKYIIGHNPANAIDHLQSLWSKIEKNPDGCWVWHGQTNKQGYGRLWFKGKQWRPHRLVWTLENGDIPEGLHVLHKCDNPPCCNPDHLFLGTDQDNADDRQAKGRLKPFKGEEHWKAKLTWKDIEYIRQYCASHKRSQSKMASLFGVNKSHLSKIIKNEAWVV